jgi:uncharacterized membrane protein
VHDLPLRLLTEILNRLVDRRARPHGPGILLPGNKPGVNAVCMSEMAFVGRLHPLVIHFPIALVIFALVAESAAMANDDERWRTVAVANLRAGAALGVIAAVAGWRLALAPGIEPTSLLEWHRWLGTIGAGVTLAAALATFGAVPPASIASWIYRIALFGAGVLVAVSGHLGGLLVWGADFLRP